MLNTCFYYKQRLLPSLFLLLLLLPDDLILLHLTPSHARALHLHALLLLGLGLHPTAVLLDQVDELVHGLVHLDALPDDILLDVEVDLAGDRADVPKVRVRHLPRAVHDAPHDRDGHPREVPRLLLDGVRDLLQVEERPAAAGAAHVVRLGAPHAAALEEAEAGEPDELRGEAPVLDDHAVPEAVHQEGPALRPPPDDDVVLVVPLQL
mmetsp:Transcript_9963/g.20155  ORF Transcript_9963/g.20155 Transcript_9963/m.20155 type:complete len:208 (+) Transcript_9963:330-953(+)